jgi:hypothetical protein
LSIEAINILIEAHSLVGCPCDVEIALQCLVVDTEVNFGVSASRMSTISARGINGELLNRSTKSEGVIVRKINKVGTTVVFNVLINPGSASTNNGVHLIHTARAVEALGDTTGANGGTILEVSLSAVP